MRWRLVLLAALVVVPLLEIYVLLQVGDLVGPVAAVLLLLAVSVLGAWLVRREGAAAWRALQGALRAGRAPTREVVDGALVLVGGVLLLTPGFLTDAVGLLLVVPGTRSLARGLLVRLLVGRLALVVGRPRPPAWGSGAGGRGSGARGRVVDGEVVEGEVDPPDGGPPSGR